MKPTTTSSPIGINPGAVGMKKFGWQAAFVTLQSNPVERILSAGRGRESNLKIIELKYIGYSQFLEK